MAEKSTTAKHYSQFFSCLLSACWSVSLKINLTVCIFPSCSRQQKIRLHPKILPGPFLIWSAECFLFFSPDSCCRDSPQPSDRRTVAGKNGTHFAHHSSRTAHRVSLPWECFEIDQFQSSGGLGREASLLLSDEREYNIRFRGKVLLHLPTSPQSLAFSRIFTSHFLREATFFFGVLISSIRCKSAPAKKAEGDFLCPWVEKFIVV